MPLLRSRWTVFAGALIAVAMCEFGALRSSSASAALRIQSPPSHVPADSIDQAKITQAKADLSSLRTALDAYELDAGAFPTTDQGLKALVEKPADAKDWHGPYLKKLPKDPWGHDYIYRTPSKSDKTKDFDLLSAGPDGKEGGGNDVH